MADFMRTTTFGSGKQQVDALSATPSRRLTLLTPEPLSTYGKAVANYVAINLPVGLQDEPNSPVKSVKELSVGLGADLEQSVAEAAQKGITEEELERQLQDQLHATVKKSADAAREELRVQVAQASNSSDAGLKNQKNLTAVRQTVATAVIQTKKDIDGYFRQLEKLLAERKEQCLAEAEMRLDGLDDQLLCINERIAEINVGCKAAGDASEGADLSLLHQKPIISEQLAAATADRWPSKPYTDESLAFHADDSIVAAIMGLGEVTGPADEDSDATATKEFKVVLEMAAGVFADVDKDKDGLINSAELKQLVYYMYVRDDAAPTELAARVKEEVEATLERFGKDPRESISLEETKRMLCSNPWKILLPEPARTNETLMNHYFGL